MQTFKKLPIANPKAITNPSIILRVYPEGPPLWRSEREGEKERRKEKEFIQNSEFVWNVRF